MEEIDRYPMEQTPLKKNTSNHVAEKKPKRVRRFGSTRVQEIVLMHAATTNKIEELMR